MNLTIRTQGAAAAAAALTVMLGLAGPAAAQQGPSPQDPHHPEGGGGAAAAVAPSPPSTPPAAPGAAPGAPGTAARPSAPGMATPGGGRPMMGGQAGMPGMMRDQDRDAMREMMGGGMSGEGEHRRMMMRHHRAGDTPMNVIINVGPDIRVRTEDGEERGDRHPGAMMGGQGGDMGQMMQHMMMMHRMMGAMAGGPGVMAGPGGMGGPGAMRPFQRIEGQLAYFRAELRITEAQTPQWNAFAEAVRAGAERLRQAAAQAMQAAAASGQGPAAPAPQQLERRIALLSAQIETMRAVAAAAATLYATLSDDQKRIADELMAEHLRDMRRSGL